MHSFQCLRTEAQVECTLTTLFEATVEAKPLLGVAEVRRKKHGWLPLLVVLFLFSYGLMTMLIVEQGRTIDSQRALIRELFRDSNALSAVRRSQSPAPGASAPADRSNAIENPSTQAPQRKAPSNQVSPKYRNPSSKAKSDLPTPSRPASDLADSERALVKI
jgi:hypothetical protein